MRRLLVAGLAALAVALGLCSMSVGTAFAADGTDCSGTPVAASCTSSTTSGTGNTTATGTGSTATSCTAPLVLVGTACTQPTATTTTAHCPFGQHHDAAGVCVPNGVGGPICTVDHNPRVPGCQNSGPIYGGGNGPWNDRLDGRYFRLDRGPALDVCDSASSSYDLFLSRNGSYRDRIVRQLNAQRWNDLRRADCGVIVSNNGDCITYVTARDSIRNWNNDYNRLRGVYNGDFNRLNTADRDNLRRLWDNSSRYRGQWDSTLSRLRTVCQDNTPAVTIIQAPPVVLQAPAPAPVYSAPAPSGVSGGSIPQGSVNTGGWSAAFVLAHNHAI